MGKSRNKICYRDKLFHVLKSVGCAKVMLVNPNIKHFNSLVTVSIQCTIDHFKESQKEKEKARREVHVSSPAYGH